MEQLITQMLERIVRRKTLHVRYAAGHTRTFGDGSGDPVAIRFGDAGAELAVGLDPVLKFGEMYMDGRMTVEAGTIYDLLSLLKWNGLRKGAMPHTAILQAARVAQARARALLPTGPEAANVAHHYDLKARLFELFLDTDMQYTCAYFEHPEQSLEDAQIAKNRHVTAKLLVEPGHRVLEMGCGWGGLGLYLGGVVGAEVDACTLSVEQATVAKARAEKAGLSDRVRFHHANYRDMQGAYDRVVSVGMLEHVGRRNYPFIFQKIAQVLDKRGVAVLHFISRPTPTFVQNPWSEKYIFPGAYIPAVSEVLPAAEAAGLLVRDVEALPLHYADTLREWRKRFIANWDEVAELYDERFCRMWEFYLASSETGFRHDRLCISHIQLSRHQDVVPRTRDYIAERSDRLREREKTWRAAAACDA